MSALDHQANYISQRLSLRDAQKNALLLMISLFENVMPSSDSSLESKLNISRKLVGSEKFQEFERDFPSFTFALATGVGKTRLMGAFISWLFSKKGIRDFLVLAPNLPIYDKLIQDFSSLASPKYVFQGISEFVYNPPRIITGDNYAQVNTQRHIQRSKNQLSLLGEEVYVNIFNISKLNIEKGRIKKLREELGESYFEYLKNLKKLVVLMDESHHYRAQRGIEVINELKPILGLELTATPFISRGTKSEPFKNVVYEYPLANAVKDELVKIPSIATRRNLDKKVLARLSEDEIDKMKLEDSIMVHRQTKVDLELYSRTNSVPLVKPFILVITQDTNHAQEIISLIQSDFFYDGYYQDRVITVHSAQKGEEKEDNIQKLISLEDPRNNVEIVVHVNMLKEGWDVTNLYTIVPLRKFAAQVLTEQTLGRGLRLPYGKRTGVVEVDRLTVMAHDKFEELIEESKKPGNILLKEYYIESERKSDPQEIVTVSSIITDSYNKELAKAQKIKNEEERRTAENKVVLKKIIRQNIYANSSSLSGIKQLTEAIIQEKIKTSVKSDISNEDLPLFDIAYNEVVNELSTRAIEIPRITIQPSTQIKAGFKNFQLDTSSVPKFEPVSEEILVKYLTDHQEVAVSSIREGKKVEEVIENSIVNRLIDFDDVDYDRDAVLLYSLVQDLIAFLRSYIKDQNALRNVVQYHVDKLAIIIHEQLEKHFYLDKASFEETNVLPFTEIYPQNYAVPIGHAPKEFRSHIKNQTELRSTLFVGFKKSCHPLYKFDSDQERMFAIVLEDDQSVEKWLRPSKKQFNIYWKHYSSKYEPDFIVETSDAIFMVEIKRENELRTEDVKDKTRAALEYCKNASAFTKLSGGKPWVYILLPHTEIGPTKKMDYYKSFRVES